MPVIVHDTKLGKQLLKCLYKIDIKILFVSGFTNYRTFFLIFKLPLLCSPLIDAASFESNNLAQIHYTNCNFLKCIWIQARESVPSNYLRRLLVFQAIVCFCIIYLFIYLFFAHIGHGEIMGVLSAPLSHILQWIRGRERKRLCGRTWKKAFRTSESESDSDMEDSRPLPN